jgi:hypothetical protein
MALSDTAPRNSIRRQVPSIHEQQLISIYTAAQAAVDCFLRRGYEPHPGLDGPSFFIPPMP